MRAPSSDELFEALDGTWPAAEFVARPPWLLRRGADGGQRVSAATSMSNIKMDDVGAAETEMRNLNQTPLFMIRPGDEALDGWLAHKNYDVVDPVAAYVCECHETTALNDTVTPHWPPTKPEIDIWKSGGIGPPRIAVMERAAGKRTCLSSSLGSRVVGTAFVAIHNNIAMLHALEVEEDQRRQGMGRRIMLSAVAWAAAEGATWFSLMVTRANGLANALYTSLGMVEVTRYHYRRAPEVPR